MKDQFIVSLFRGNSSSENYNIYSFPNKGTVSIKNMYELLIIFYVIAPNKY